MTDTTEMPERRRDDPVTILSLVMAEMGKMEARLTAAISSHSDAETARWTRHEVEHAQDCDRWKAHDAQHHAERDLLGTPVERAGLFTSMRSHLAAEAQESLVMQTRLQPVRAAGHWLRREWRTILLWLSVIGATIANFADRAGTL